MQYGNVNTMNGEIMEIGRVGIVSASELHTPSLYPCLLLLT